jgi:hypothetical protein
VTVLAPPIVINGITVPPILQQLGFSHVAPAVDGLRRAFISSEGLTGSGKTHFIGTAPGPVIAVVDFDRGLTGVLDSVEKVGDKLIMRKTFPMVDFDQDDPVNVGRGMESARLVASEAERKMAAEVFEQFKNCMSQILRSKNPDGTRQVATLAVDNGGDPYTLCQAARFGKLARLGEVQGSAWRIVNYEFEQIFKEADEHNVNLIVTHRRKSKFQGAGELEIDGYKGIRYASQAHILHHVGLKRNEHGIPFKPEIVERKIIFIEKCRQRPALVEPTHPQHELPIVMLGEGKWFGGQFINVVQAMLPNTTREDWFGEGA